MSGSDKTKNKRGAYHHGDLRAAALNEALRVVDELGVDTLSLRKIGEALGVTHKALYRHFPSKAALMASIAASGYRMLTENALRSEKTPTGFCRAYLDFALSHAELYRLVIDSHAAARTPELDAAIRQFIEAAQDVFPDDREIYRVWLLMHGGLSLKASGALRAPECEPFPEFLIDLAGLEGDTE